MKKIFLILFLLIHFNSYAVPKKFLFDATKAETAGNADWVIDEDNHIAQRFPTPDQSGITSSTPENYWTGALSSWGIALVQQGHTVETLPNGTPITYGNISNPQDLSNYDVYVIDEPNSPFTLTEKIAIINFVQNGGGLFLISDHAGADRNGDGWDAIRVINDLIRNNSVHAFPFGLILDSLTFSETSSNINSDSISSPILNGPIGSVSRLKFSNGTSISINISQNPNAKGIIWRTSSSQGNLNLMIAQSEFGTGRVMLLGDSSPADDGTGSSGHMLYPGWTELGANHSRLHLNASLWLAKLTGTVGITNKNVTPIGFKLEQNFPNPFNPNTIINYELSMFNCVTLKVYNDLGNVVATLVNEKENAGSYSVEFDGSNLSSGIYFYELKTEASASSGQVFSERKKMMLIK